MELGKLVQEQHTVVCKADFARGRLAGSTQQPLPKGDRKPVRRIDAHHGGVEVNEFLLGENADGFRIDLVGDFTRQTALAVLQRELEQLLKKLEENVGP
jgi:hypothetical protein